MRTTPLHAIAIALVLLAPNARAQDSLYHAARTALSDGDYRRAADLFRRVGETYPKSAQVEPALYYRAFALYRDGENADLQNALVTLKQLAARYPKSSTTLHDAVTLRTRICATLARQGNAGCAADISQQADSASKDCSTEEDDSDIRIAALNGLMLMDGQRALPILRKVLDRRDACSIGLRRKALMIVVQKDDPDVVDILMSSARQDPSSDVREQAVFWLSQSHSPRAAGILDSILVHSDDDALRERALFALSQQSDSGAAKLRRFAARDDTPEGLREKAIFWLGESTAPADRAYLQEMFGRTTNEAIKEKILFALSQHGESRDWLLHVATDSHEPVEVRKKAIFWAGQGGVPLNQLTDLYSRLDDHDLREQLIFVFGQRPEPAAFDELVTIAKTDKDPEARRKAVFWLGQSSDPRAAQALQELIDK
jgi:HEAT repeat protein